RDAPPTQTRIDWRLNETYALIHRLQPAALIGANHHVTPFLGEDFQMFERDLPGQNTAGFSADAVVSDLPLETCETVNGSWGYRASDRTFKSVDELTGLLAKAVANNANLLLNIGPRPDGTIDEESADRFRAIGKWLQTNGESIYGARGGPIEPQPWGVTTERDGTVYLHLLDVPAPIDGWTSLSAAGELAGRSLLTLDGGHPIASRPGSDGTLQIELPAGAHRLVLAAL
ncbi:MAG: alpha-L-fucosidase, partial [Planctomycetota bacterium]